MVKEKITESDYQHLLIFPVGETLRSKEEIYSFRIFREYFKDLDPISRMGRIKATSESTIQLAS